MGSYYYLDDPNSESGYFPLPEEEYLKAYKDIVKRHGINITDKMILEEYLGKTKGSNSNKKPRMINIRSK